MGNLQENPQMENSQNQNGNPQRRNPFEGMGEKILNIKMRNILIALGVITAIIIFSQIYFSLMSFSLYNVGLRVFFIVLALIWSVPFAIYFAKQKPKKGEQIKAFKNIHWGWSIPVGIAIVIVLISICLAIFTTPMFMATQYNQMVNVKVNSGTIEEPYKEFTEEVDDFYKEEMKVAIIDEAFASMLGEKVLGEGSGGYASQYSVNDYTLIYYKNSLYWVGALEPKGFFQWTSSSKTGTPGYVLVDATQTSENATAELVTSHKIKFTPSAFFHQDAQRQMYFSNMTALRDSKLNLELDDNGVPYYTQSIYKKKFGLTNGDEVTGVLVMNAETGECKTYATDKAPEWMDNVQSANITLKQVDYWGEYSHGYFNTWFAKREVNNTTAGYNYVYTKGQLYITTGITAKSGDNAIVGMVLSNMRTKQTTMYNMVGATEQAAMNSAQGIQEVAAAGYTATFPTLINFNGVPTFYMALKDKSGNIKMYAYVNVKDYTSKLVAGTSPEVAKQKYAEIIKDQVTDSPVSPEGEQFTATITTIDRLTIDGNDVFYIAIGDANYEVVAKNVKGAVKLVRAKDGNTLTYRIKNGKITEIISVK